jgi:hypothetical protein
MTQSSFIVALVAYSGFGQAETKLDLFAGDSLAGRATYSEKFDHKGRKTSVFRLYGSTDPSVKRTIVQVRVIDSRAFPISEEETIVEEGPRGKSEILLKVRYDDSGAAILDMTRDRLATITRSYVPLPGYSRADASDLWFSKSKPSQGTSISSTVFDIENAKWQRVETTYLGKHWISVSGRKIEVHEVRDVRDGVVREVFLDDRGQPVLMRTGQYRTEKHF